MLWSGAGSYRQGNGAIEGHEPSPMFHRESEQISIGYLARPVNMIGVHVFTFDQADRARPELVKRRGGCLKQSFDGLGGRNRVRILWLAEDTNESVLSQSAGRPAVSDFPGEPFSGSPMADVIYIQQRKEHIDIEERPHHSGSSSRSLLISSLETTPPREGIGRKP